MMKSKEARQTESFHRKIKWRKRWRKAFSWQPKSIKAWAPAGVVPTFMWNERESVRCASGSAALNVFLYNHTAVSEERTGQILLQRPRVQTGIKRLHASQSRTLAAHHPTAHINLPVQNHGAARHDRDIHEELLFKQLFITSQKHIHQRYDAFMSWAHDIKYTDQGRRWTPVTGACALV